MKHQATIWLLVTSFALTFIMGLMPLSGSFLDSNSQHTLYKVGINQLLAAPACGTDDPFCLDKTAIEAELTPSKITNPKVALAQSLGRIISVGLGMIGILFFLLLLYAGTRWMIARGNQEDVDKAKGTIEHAAIGLIVVAVSYALVTFMVETLFSPQQIVDPGPGNPRVCLGGSCITGTSCPTGHTTPAGSNCGTNQICCVAPSQCQTAGHTCALLDTNNLCPGGASPRSETCPSPLRCCP